MNLFRYYVDYLKDNPQGYWFKRKLFGWGWTPATWQGFLTLFAYIAAVFLLTFTLKKTSSTPDVTFAFFLPILVLTTALLTICYKKGEKPQWQWGVSRRNQR